MVEKNKQIVIFGNFDSINFDDVSLLSEIKQRYSFVLGAQEDVPLASGPAQQIALGFNQLVLRPLLKSTDGRVSVFFGTKRIHIEEKEAKDVDYDIFVSLAKDILSHIICRFSLLVERVAVNGTFFSNDATFIRLLFSRFFANNELIRTDMDDWAFRINNKGFDDKKRPLNRIVSAQLRKEIQGVSLVDGLYLSYDYNTLPNQVFQNIDELRVFIDEGRAFRNKVISHD